MKLIALTSNKFGTRDFVNFDNVLYFAPVADGTMIFFEGGVRIVVTEKPNDIFIRLFGNEYGEG